jgi:Ni/Fe-hydrogenase subunit HybB-like protein
MAEKPKLNPGIAEDLIRPLNLKNKSFLLWIGLLMLLLLICLYAYTLQLKTGLGITGLRDFVSWGAYISNFVFFVAVSLIGMLISAVLGLIGFRWITPITRIAEIIAFAFAAVAGLVIISDMGRPERLPYVFIYGRFQSPILWDVTVVITYVVMSALLYFLPLIPDTALLSKSVLPLPAWQRKLYSLLSLHCENKSEQAAIIRKCMTLLIIMIIPVALAIHTVTSWLFASTPRAGWDSSIFGPYFVSGAFVAGCSAVIIAMFFYRNNYKLHDYLTDMHFDKMGKLLVLVSLIYLYFNLNEYLVPAYKLKKADALHLTELFTGRYALLFYSVQLLGLIIPIILLLFRKMRRPLPILAISVTVFFASWFKRYLIVIPVQEIPYLPIQHVPMNFKLYYPTVIEIALTLAPFILVLIIITVLSKLFPVISITGLEKEKFEDHNPNDISLS